MQRKNTIPKAPVKNPALAPEILDLIEILTEIAIHDIRAGVPTNEQKDDEKND